MNAAVYLGEQSFAVEERPRSKPGPNMVEIAVAYTGICGTDLHIYHGTMDGRVAPPSIIGHEMSGTIAEVGDGVTGLSPGDPVTVMPLDPCGDCPACRDGHAHICHRLNFVGIDSPGSMQGSWVVPANVVIPLPAGLSLRDAALAEPVAVAAHDVRRADIKDGETVVVIGGGPIGILIAHLARERGADILVSEPNEHRRRMATEFGFAVIDPINQDVADHVATWTGGRGADVAFEVSGAAAGVTTMTQVLATRGRAVVVAIHGEPKPVDLFQVFWRELTLIGTRVYEREDFDAAIAHLAAGVIPTSKLISGIVPLGSVTEAFEQLERGDAVMKILIDCKDAG